MCLNPLALMCLNPLKDNALIVILLNTADWFRPRRIEMRNVLPIALGAALLVAFSGSALAAGDAAKGAELFKATCGICHQIGPGAKTLVGPELR